MKRYLLATIFVCMFWVLAGDIEAYGQNSGRNAVDEMAPTLLMSGELLAKTKTRLAESDPALKPAFDKLIKDADTALRNEPYSVTDKEKLPPSGDKHDYASYARYWWPDPDKPDGLPYIRRDGETNPDSQSIKKSDRPRIERIGIDTETLGLAYYLTGDEKYAKKAAELLRVWFLDPATRMNPNLNFAQGKPGHATGNKSGVLDGRMMVRALEGSLLIAESSALSDGERQGLKDWAGECFRWLTTEKLPQKEAAAKNNHGSFFDAQAMYFGLYAGDQEGVLKIAQQVVRKRVLSQIQLDGSMPEELDRTRPLFYSVYNLHALFLVANLSKKVGIEVFNSSDGRLRAGLDFLAPYSDPRKPWAAGSIIEENRMNLYPILLMADLAYPDGDYLQMLEKLPLKERELRRENLAVPLMR